MKEKIQKKQRNLPWYFIPAWASRALSLAVNVVVVMQLTYYCTNSLGMNPILVGNVLLASKLLDGVTDLFAGFIVDKTNTRLGKARPYEFCILIAWALTVALFSCPSFGNMGKVIYIFVMYTLINSVCATFLNATDAVYMARSVERSEDQAKVLSVNGLIVTVGCAAVTIAFPLLITLLGDQPGGWTKIILIFAVPGMLLGMGRFAFIKETVNTDTKANKEPFSLKLALNVLRNNKYIFLLAIVVLVANLANYITTGVGLYYFQYVYGNRDMNSVIGILSLVVPIFLLLIPVFMKKHSFMQIIRVCTVIGIVGNLIKFLGGTNMVTILLGSLALSIGVMPLSTMIVIPVIDIMDYNEWKTGNRVEAVFSSITGFTSKLGSGLASAAIGFITGLAGFDGTLEIQSASANTAINLLFSLIPMALMIVMLVVLMFYDIDKILPQAKKEIAERRGTTVS